MIENQNYRVWVLSDNRKFSRTWEAVTPKLSSYAANVILGLYSVEYPDKSHVVSIEEPKT